MCPQELLARFNDITPSPEGGQCNVGSAACGCGYVLCQMLVDMVPNPGYTIRMMVW